MDFFNKISHQILFAQPDGNESGSGQADPQEDDKVHSDG